MTWQSPEIIFCKIIFKLKEHFSVGKAFVHKNIIFYLFACPTIRLRDICHISSQKYDFLNKIYDELNSHKSRFFFILEIFLGWLCSMLVLSKLRLTNVYSLLSRFKSIFQGFFRNSVKTYCFYSSKERNWQLHYLKVLRELFSVGSFLYISWIIHL